jgi:phage/plasmid-like protein (TIGR03299 family)
MTAAQCLDKAGLDWPVKQDPMARFHGGADAFKRFRENPEAYIAEMIHAYPDMESVDMIYRAVYDLYKPCTNVDGEANVLANIREDTDLYLGNVTDQYVVVQNIDGFRFMDGLIDDGEMRYEAAFSLHGGKKVCMLGLMPGVDTVVPGDELLRYILLSLNHDGSGSIRFGPTSVRVVCANTHRIAIEQKGTKVAELKIRHSGDIMEKLGEAKAILEHAHNMFDGNAELCRQLAQHHFNAADWIAFLDVVCPEIPSHHPDWTERRGNAIAETRQQITDAYHADQNTTAPMTAWAAFNAVTQHQDHLPRKGRGEKRKAEARFNVTFYGTGHDHKQFAWETACRMANAS